MPSPRKSKSSWKAENIWQLKKKISSKFMLYSLIPPFLVIVSLVIIIIFIVKKAPRLERYQDSMMEKMSEEEASGMTAEEIMKGKPLTRWERFKNWILSILEKIAKRFRLMFLKLDTHFKNLSERIRKRRERKTMRTSGDASRATNNNQEGTRILLNEDGESYVVADEEPQKTNTIVSSPTIRKPKPMISEKVVTPAKKPEIKDRLEDILIERIAINSKDVEAYERLGEYYMDIGNNDYAKECFKQVIKLNPANRSAKFKLKKIEKILAS
jgi:hypothetical protein